MNNMTKLPRADERSDPDMPTMLQAALDYATDGWPVFPCSINKQPKTEHGVLDATTDKEQIRKWWTQWPKANIGFHPHEAGLMVLDLDPGHDKAELEEKYGDLKTRLKARTPRGGEHWFYQTGEDKRRLPEIIPASASKVADHVDVRSFNSYVLLWPSRTKDGMYEWIEKDGAHYRPDKLAEVCKNARAERHTEYDDWEGIDIDSEDNVNAAITWINSDHCHSAIEYQGGNQRTYGTACMMRSFGLSEEMALEVLTEHYNTTKCTPPWESDDLDTICRNAYRYAASPPGNKTPEYEVQKASKLFKPVEIKTPEGQSSRVGKFRFSDVDALYTIGAPPWLINDFLPSLGYAIIYAPTNTGKTFVALDITLTLATEPDDWMEQTTVWGDFTLGRSRGPVLFAAGEGVFGIKERVAAWSHWHNQGNRPRNLYMVDPVPHLSDDLDGFIAEALRYSPDGYKLVVIDTIARALAGERENDMEIATAFTSMVQVLQRELDCTVLALHHTNKAGKEMRGSGAFEADADTVVHLSNEHNRIALTMDKQKDAEKWARPRILQLTDVQYSDKQSSLVAVPVPPEEIKNAEDQQKANDKSKHSAKNHELTLSVVDKAVRKQLASTPGRVYTQSDLAVALSYREDVELSAEQLRKRTLTELREKKDTCTHKFFDPLPKKYVLKPGWKY